MSMFRKPGEDSSSEDEISESREETTNASAEDALLSRINTLESSQSMSQSASTGLRVAAARPSATRSNTSDQFRDLVLHSLLEDKAIRDAAEHLGKDRSDPEVQALARSTYQSLAQQLSGTIDNSYAGDEMRQQRTAAQEGIDRATRGHLTGLSATANATATAAVAGASQALVSRQFLGLPVGGLESLNVIRQSIPLSLQGHTGLHTDRYAREYEEVGLVGKGGYGKVYKVKHKLDDSFYAVKRIMVSATKLQKIQEGGAQELESLLQEVRSLARLDHGNIVRYHSAWLEYSYEATSAPLSTSRRSVRRDRLLEDASSTSFDVSDVNQAYPSFDSVSIDDPFERSHQHLGADIVFETSDTGAGGEEPKHGAYLASLNERATRRANRRGSQATIATISSAHSRMSAVEDVLAEDEEDIETIPRTHEPLFEESESIMSNSDIPAHLVAPQTTGPTLTLNVQMSLYDSNLAAFISSDQNSPSHCFHPIISLELLSGILSGVAYLHECGVVHRDLKPANIFLSLSNGRVPPAGSVNLSNCRSCSDRACMHVTPRIGDFGLVAALGDSCLTAEAAAKPVGTEFYRPPAGGRISEKLDVFALGVVAYEMLQRFGTRMERVDSLTKLRRGEFPPDFAASIGRSGKQVQQMLSGMVNLDEEERWNCEEVRDKIAKIVRFSKV